jgi:transcriptional regulator with XRE-family HTH domain
MANVASMVTRIHKSARRRLFLKEHREHKGVSAEAMAGRLDIERESVYRLEREQWRVKSETQLAWADALGIEPEDLWRLPETPSVDALLSQASPEVKEMAADIVRRLVAKG